MPVIEAPFCDQCPGFEGTTVPDGTFVLFRIDPVASVAALEDEETTRAAAALGTQDWVLGVVSGIRGGMSLDPLRKPVMSLQFELFGQGPPSDKPVASLPVAPAPQLYDDRPPIVLDAPLPWPNLYVHTGCPSSIIVSRIHYGPNKFEVNMTKDQFLDMSRKAFDDQMNWDTLPPVATPEPPAETLHVYVNEPRSSSAPGVGDDSSDDGDSFMAEEMAAMNAKLDKLRVYGEICLDPSMCPGPLGIPLNVKEPIFQIRELWADWEERATTEILAKRPETNAWAQNLADALDAQSDVASVQTLPDENVITPEPEDAVDTGAETEIAPKEACPATVEAPFWDQFPGFEGAFVPTGTFVLVRIDPVASVAVLEDEETTRAAAALGTHGWVLGAVTGILGGMLLDPASNRINMSLQLALFGQGPPSDKPIASLPISPAPQLYDDRPPLELDAPLPWANIYAHTKYSTSLIISRIYHGPTKIEPTLTKAQHKDVCLRGMKDVSNWHNLPPVTIPETLVDPVYVDPRLPEPSERSDEDESYEEDNSPVAQKMEDMGVKIAKLRICGEISVDPTMYPEPLGAPCELLDPVRRIRQLWDDWEARRTTEILARRPEMNVWAQRVADEVLPREHEPDVVSIHTMPDDDLVLPEDAVDDRVERLLASRRNDEGDPVPQQRSRVGHTAESDESPRYLRVFQASAHAIRTPDVSMSKSHVHDPQGSETNSVVSPEPAVLSSAEQRALARALAGPPEGFTGKEKKRASASHLRLSPPLQLGRLLILGAIASIKRRFRSRPTVD